MRRIALLGVLLVVGAAAGLFGRAALDGGGGGAPSGPDALPVVPVSGETHVSLDDAAVEPGRGVAIVARGRRAVVPVYARPGATQPQRRLVRRTVDGSRLPVIFLVLARRSGGWLKVSLPVRPNHASAWVRSAAVRLARDPYRVEVQLGRHRLLVYEHDRVLLRAPIGVGRAVSPTPTGRYFLADLLRPPDPGGFYGPYAFGLSAYSPVYTSFAGGDGQIGIHGTDAPGALGGDVSHGCIRVRNGVIARLARELPLGTPVWIRA
ncbi:MAG TPA: L,D-transpeptidase [Conexibacter sp.]|nr:L,D-transpeptidase [Conexibacter sp.]